MLRETLCVAQTAINTVGDPRRGEHVARLQRLIDECDRHRPLGPDGKHNDRHTPTCGCEDREGPRPVTTSDIDPSNWRMIGSRDGFVVIAAGGGAASAGPAADTPLRA